MSLIELRNIGKIYVSDGNVAVGIRGVNLCFDRGEFVAVTGASGSGKSTLLNVISGMDTYEEGEMLIEGQPTSHYQQKDFEAYRQEYISFVFQDYNIIESFTVLQNVELALLYITDAKERRHRAQELIRRVGLWDQQKQKGSQLSGGQKQRTVIARALAKDSPVILADEPTGNLDSKSSEEIIDLLREVSRDKLVIMVTHSFDQVAAYATRHIRIFDGAVESDRRLTPTAAPTPPAKRPADAPKEAQKKVRAFTKKLRDGWTLGRVRFAAMPRLSVFLCVLMILSSLLVTSVTGFLGDAFDLFEEQTLFTPIDGRVIVARRDGAVMSEAEFAALAEDMGAERALRYDFLLDHVDWILINGYPYDFCFSSEAPSKIDGGRMPTEDGEVLLCLPVSFLPTFGKGESFFETVLEDVFHTLDYRVVGVSYYYDNTRLPSVVFSEQGYQTATAVAYFTSVVGSFYAHASLEDDLSDKPLAELNISGTQFRLSFELPVGSYYLRDTAFREAVRQAEEYAKAHTDYTYRVTGEMGGKFTDRYYGTGGGSYELYREVVGIKPGGGSYGKTETVTNSLDGYDCLLSVSEELSVLAEKQGAAILLSPDLIADFMQEQYYAKAYTQGSLFFESDRAAERKIAELEEKGYVAVRSDSAAKQEGVDALLNTILLLFPFLGWVLAVLFTGFFLAMCTSRAMLAIKGDIAILRSMGIETAVVRVSVYVQTLLSLLPAYLVTAALTALIFLTPSTNDMLTYLHAKDYLLIAVTLLAIALLVARRHTRKMFGDSVKKTLKTND